MRSRALTALPAFAATYGGVAAYVNAKDGRWELTVVVLAGLVAFGYATLWVGRKVMPSKPVLGVVIMSGWILAIVAVGAGLTAVFLWVGLRLPEWITTGEVTDDVKEIAKVLLGAATAFAAVLFTDDLDKAEGELWPSTKTKAAMGEAYSGQFEGGSTEYEAVYEDRVAPVDNVVEIKGWGFVPRIRRAQVIAS